MAEITLQAKVENIRQVVAFVEEKLEAMGCAMKAQMQLSIAVDELFTNIACYAYAPGSGMATVRVEAISGGQQARITFIDQGVPYNPLEKSDPDTTLPAEKRQIGGLGIYMVKKSMDVMTYEYRNGYNILTIKKRVS